MGVSEERNEIARLCEDLAQARSLEIKLFATELAGRIRARSVQPTDQKIGLAEVSRLLGICRGKIARLVADKTLPEPDDHGLFPKTEIMMLRSWLSSHMAADQFARINRLREASRKPGPGQASPEP